MKTAFQGRDSARKQRGVRAEDQVDSRFITGRGIGLGIAEDIVLVDSIALVLALAEEHSRPGLRLRLVDKPDESRCTEHNEQDREDSALGCA